MLHLLAESLLFPSPLELSRQQALLLLVAMEPLPVLVQSARLLELLSPPKDRCFAQRRARSCFLSSFQLQINECLRLFGSAIMANPRCSLVCSRESR